jgi:hypothetical protein
MPPTRTRHQDDIRLRFVFDNRVVSVDCPTDLSYWEIAEALDDLRERYGEPTVIDLLTGSRQEQPHEEEFTAPRLSRIRPAMA